MDPARSIDIYNIWVNLDLGQVCLFQTISYKDQHNRYSRVSSQSLTETWKTGCINFIESVLPYIPGIIPLKV